MGCRIGLATVDVSRCIRVVFVERVAELARGVVRVVCAGVSVSAVVGVVRMMPVVVQMLV